VSPIAARSSSRLRALRADDRGVAVVEFVMVSVLLIFLLFAVLQVGALFYVRNIVAASAADGARYAAGSGVDASAGGDRAASEISRNLSGSVARSLACTGTVAVDTGSGLATTVVRCQGSVRSIFLPIGSLVHLDVTARSLTESTR
jgi:Flp pilus assembly protein TadG